MTLRAVCQIAVAIGPAALLIAGVGCRPFSAPLAPAPTPNLVSEGTLAPFATLDSAESADIGSYRFTLPVDLHGRSLHFVADHGATTTIMTDSTIEAARLPHHYANATRTDTLVKGRRRARTTGPGPDVVVVRGDSTFEYWGTFPPEVVDSIRVGTSLQRDLFIASEAPAASLYHADGLLGRDVLSQFDLEFNLPQRKLRLYTRSPSTTNKPAWLPPGLVAADCVAAPVVRHMGIDRMEMDSSDMVEVQHNPGKRMWDQEELLLPLEVNGHAIAGNFDSGSGETIMNWAAARLLGLSHKSPNVTPMSTGSLTLFSFHGSARSTEQDTTNYRATGVRLRLGGRTLSADSVLISDPTFVDFDDYQTKPLILVGLRQLRDDVLFFSYSTGQVCVGAPTPQ